MIKNLFIAEISFDNKRNKSNFRCIVISFVLSLTLNPIQVADCSGRPTNQTTIPLPITQIFGYLSIKAASASASASTVVRHLSGSGGIIISSRSSKQLEKVHFS